MIIGGNVFDSTMQHSPLTITAMLRHGEQVHAESRVLTYDGEGVTEASFREVGQRVRRLASALTDLGIGSGDRVGTLMWNTQEHLEAYFAVPAMGAVLHTLNLRLHPDQLAYIVNHAADRIIIVHADLVPMLVGIAPELTTVELVVVVDSPAAEHGAGADLPIRTIGYEQVLAGGNADHQWPELDETSGAAMCYTSGTTGNPKGVVYSHRSTYLHSLATSTGNAFALTEHDRVLPIVPMFHANAWGLPYSGWFAGCDFVLPGKFLQAVHVARMIESYRVTFTGAVPTIFSDLLRWVDAHATDLSSLRLTVCGGSAVPPSLMEQFQRRHGVRLIQAWGMTETSPLAAISNPPPGVPNEWEMRPRTGRAVAGVELRIVGEDGALLPHDGTTVGEVEVRGPWITGAYYAETSPNFHDGWLRTGDVGTVSPSGYLQITDRTKDVIKSGGEWVSSVALENTLMAHPAVREAAVIAVPDDRWEERPLACVVFESSMDGVGHDELAAFLADKVARWWIPERWTTLDDIPKTSVGKFDKKLLRALYGSGRLRLDTLQLASERVGDR